MKITRHLIALSVPLLPRTVAAWGHVPDAGSLKSALENNDYTLVAFTHPIDENSQSLEAEWTSIQVQPADYIASVDCSSEPKLCSELGISSFPTIRMYRRDGTFSRYRGPRHADAMAAFLRRMLRPTISLVNTENTTNLFTSDDIVFIAHLAPNDDTGAHDRFTRSANKYRDRFTFALSTDNLPAQGQQSKVECYNIPDQLQRTLTGLGSPSALEDFIKLCSTPLIPELTRRNEMGYYQSGKSLVHYFIHTSGQRAAYVSAMRPLARKYQEYLHFSTTDANEYADAAEMLGLRLSPGGTGLAVQNPSNGDVFPFRGSTEGIGADVVEAFLVDIIQGRIRPPGAGAAGQAGPAHEEL